MGEQIVLTGLSVCVGMPVGKEGIHPRTMMSLLNTQAACLRVGINFSMSSELRSGVQIGRNFVLMEYLAGEAQKLFWIDSDMVWTPDAFIRLLAMSQRRAVVCAAYPARTDPPTFFAKSADGDGKVIRGDYGLVEIAGTGLGFCIMDRAVCQAFADSKPKVRDQISGRVMPWAFRFDSVEPDADGIGHLRTEDMAMYADLRELGFKCYADPDIVLGHVGEKVYEGKLSDTFAEAPAEKIAAE